MTRCLVCCSTVGSPRVDVETPLESIENFWSRSIVSIIFHTFPVIYQYAVLLLLIGRINTRNPRYRMIRIAGPVLLYDGCFARCVLEVATFSQ